MIMEAGKSEICRVDCQAEELQWSPKIVGWRIPSCSRKDSLFYIQAFDWFDEAHSHYWRQSALLKKVHWLKCKSHLKTPLQKHSEYCLTNYVITMVQENWHIKLIFTSTFAHLQLYSEATSYIQWLPRKGEGGKRHKIP